MVEPIEGRPRVVRTWYRWVTPDGEIWAVSSNPNEIINGQAKRLKLKLFAQTVYEITTPWREIVDVQLPES